MSSIAFVKVFIGMASKQNILKLWLLGAMAPNKREKLWKEKRVFFMTPQVLQNDLAKGSCSPKDIVCLVFDEAHRALGDHSYSQVSNTS